MMENEILKRDTPYTLFTNFVESEIPIMRELEGEDV